MTTPGRNLNALAYQDEIGPQPHPSVKPYSWFYPVGATRWGVFRGLATSSMVKAMLTATGGTAAGEFVMKMVPKAPGTITDARYTVTTDLFMLPPRPLGETRGYDGLYLITLVDERWYWQGTPVSLRVTSRSTWAGLIQDISTALGVSITLPVIPPEYGQPEPDSQLWTDSESSPVLLDAIALNLGCQVVRKLDGEIVLMRPADFQEFHCSRGIHGCLPQLCDGRRPCPPFLESQVFTPEAFRVVRGESRWGLFCDRAYHIWGTSG